jgi:hypothetical protein
VTKLLDLPWISRVRRNHALEHATLNLLSSRLPGKSLGGLSDAAGFWIIGTVAVDTLSTAVVDALNRLRAGERRLAFHAGCGTGYAVTGIIAGSLAWLGMLGVKDGYRQKLDRLPLVITLAMLGAVAAQPLGTRLQTQVTTNAQPGGLEITGIRVFGSGIFKISRVSTRG